MIEHMCMFKCKGALPEDRIQAMVDGFLGLKGIIPGLLEVSVGRNTTEETQFRHEVDLGLRMLFETHDDLRAYLLHPAHVKVSQFVFTCIDDVTVCDFDV